MKTCSRCKEAKSKSEFGKDKSQKDGLQHRCKACRKESNNKYYEQNKEAIREKGRKYREANREAIREQRRKYREANREVIRERKKKYWEANREAIHEKQRKYREANQEAILEYQRKYREANREALIKQDKKNREENQAISRVFATKSGGWTPEEEQFIIGNMHQMTNLQLALALERTVESVGGKIRRMRKKGLIK